MLFLEQVVTDQQAVTTGWGNYGE